VQHGGPIWRCFPGEHVDILTNPVEICFGSFTMT
jgi:hypothetical protein